jgi:hypothetical protein
VFLEIAVALAIAVIIVWWTFPRRPKADDAQAPRPRPSDEA